MRSAHGYSDPMVKIIPGEKGRNCGVPSSTSKKDARAEAVQCSPPSFSCPCIQPGLAKPHLWPHLSGCMLTLSWSALNKVHNSSFLPSCLYLRWVIPFSKGHWILNVYVACASESFKENHLLSKSAGGVFTCMQYNESFMLGSKGQNKGRVDENIYRASGEVTHGESSLLCHPQFAESSDISIVFQCTAHKCNVPLL